MNKIRILKILTATVALSLIALDGPLIAQEKAESFTNSIGMKFR